MVTVRVWDIPTRLFHWCLVVLVIALVVTGNVGGNAMAWHFRAGYAVMTLLLFRLVWGFIGGYWSRFVNFVRGPSAILNYLKGNGEPAHSVGHNPIGAGSVLAMLGFLLAQVGSGLMSDDDISFAGPLTSLVSNATVQAATFYHKEVGKAFLIVLVLLHLAAIVYYRKKKKTDLITPMIKGDKLVATTVPLPSSADTGKTRLLAVVVMVLCAFLVRAVVNLGAPV
jgi:cytochrome b